MPQNQARQETSPAGVFEMEKLKILFVSGKGGVGKSLLAAGIAAHQAKAGRKVLLAEIGDNSYYKDFFSLPSVNHEPVSTEFGFDIAMWSGESSLKEYVLHFLKLERLYHIFFENRVMRALINVAPGLNEIAVLGKITSGVRHVGPRFVYDLVVVDCFATGHALSLFRAPRGMMEAIGFGPMGAQSREMDAVLRDQKICGYAVVTLMEEMPVVETMEFVSQLHQSLNVQAQVFANKVFTVPTEGVDLKNLGKIDPKGLGEFALYLDAVIERQNRLRKMLIDFLHNIVESSGATKFTESAASSKAKCSRVQLTELPLIFSNNPSELLWETVKILQEKFKEGTTEGALREV